MKMGKLFLLSASLTASVTLFLMYLNRPDRGRWRPPHLPGLQLKQISEKVYLTSQLNPVDLPVLTQRGIKTVVDIRPDGEVTGQPPSYQIKSASNGQGLGFYYIPVPHEGIPDDAVEKLNQALTPEALPALLYCRTGRRAVRLFALVQASRVDGPGSDAIMEMVRAAGFSANDLRNEINQRVSHRSSAATQ